MSEYLSKKAVLESIGEAYQTSLESPDQTDWDEGYRSALRFMKRTVLSGAFDADDSEIQRLRAALMDTSLLIEDMAVSRIDDFCRLRDNARAMVAMIHSALSTITEPINAEKVERVREGDGNDV